MMKCGHITIASFTTVPIMHLSVPFSVFGVLTPDKIPGGDSCLSTQRLGDDECTHLGPLPGETAEVRPCQGGG